MWTRVSRIFNVIFKDFLFELDPGMTREKDILSKSIFVHVLLSESE
jgi:hypothetical protein